MKRAVTIGRRLNHEPPAVTAKLGLRYAPTEPSVGARVAFILEGGAPVELLKFYTAKAARPKARHAAEQRAALDDGAPAKEMLRRR